MALEKINDVIHKRFGNSLTCLLKLVDPERKFSANLELSKAWSRLSLTEQRRLYLYLLYKKWRGDTFYGTPYDIVTNCHPYPTNWNEHLMAESLLKSKTRMVIAHFGIGYGTYTLDEAKVWNMTDIQPLNYKDVNS